MLRQFLRRPLVAARCFYRGKWLSARWCSCLRAWRKFGKCSVAPFLPPDPAVALIGRVGHGRAAVRGGVWGAVAAWYSATTSCAAVAAPDAVRWCQHQQWCDIGCVAPYALASAVGHSFVLLTLSNPGSTAMARGPFSGHSAWCLGRRPNVVRSSGSFVERRALAVVW